MIKNIPERLDRLPISTFHKKLLWICGLGTLFDAMDVGIVSSVMASLSKEWGLKGGGIGAIGSAGFIGMFVGAIIAGPLADRFGRKVVFSFTLAWFGLFTFLNAFAWDLNSMLAFRFLAGIGLGAEVPIVAAYFSELVPAKSRGRMITLYEGFFPWGLIFASILGFLLVPNIGWPSVFIAGSVPVLLIIFIRRYLPESPRWLLERNRIREADEITTGIENKIIQEKGQIAEVHNKQPNLKNASDKIHISEVWSRHYLKRTLLLWTCWFSVFYATYGFLLWLPSFWVQNGVPLSKSLFYNILITFSQVPGFWLVTLVIDRIGRKSSLILSLVIGLIGALGFGLNTAFSAQLSFGLILAFGNAGAMACLYTYTPELYPTRMRATAVSFASAWGRIGGIVAPIITGLVLGTAGNKSSVFLIMFAVLAVSLIVVSVLGRETKGENLETVSEVQLDKSNNSASATI